MKRIVLLLVAVAGIAFLSTSCVKDRVCKCTSASQPAANENFVYEMSSKTTATADCENQQYSGRISWNSDYTCVLE